MRSWKDERHQIRQGRDEESERQQDRQDVSMGVMSHAEYRAKWYGEYKSSLDTVSEQLKAFDGVDVADLNGQIKKLQDDLKAKDKSYAMCESKRVSERI